ncbi:MAG: hypothetical protein HRU75_02995 [Planctomycetia bacterium]|nr:MAG: hypothetical protein HRU75_02995 [Planctomycetia bacterium]
MNMKSSQSLFAALIGLSLAGPTALAADTPEVEPNGDIGSGTPATLMCGDSLSGTISSPSDTDYWHITTAPQPAGAYRYRLTSAGWPSRSGVLFGLSQTDGVINTAEPVPAQFSTSSGSAPFVNQWYGFGSATTVDFAMSASQISPYSVQFSCEPVTIHVFPRALETGSLQFLSGSVDAWVYDTNFLPLPDNNCAGTHTLAPGVYYIVGTLNNLANDQACPNPAAADADRPVLAYPGAVLSANFSTTASIQVRIVDGFGQVLAPSVSITPYTVAFWRFEVVPPPEIACCFPNGSCQPVTRVDCAQQGGVAQGFGSTCTSNPCPQPAACCRPDGSCEMTLFSGCHDGQWQGTGSSCITVTCIAAGACCFQHGDCAVLFANVCTNQGGAAQGAGTNCGSITCQALCLRGDADCNGRVDNFDIDPYIIGILFANEAPPPALYTGTPQCWTLRTCWGDVNRDNHFNSFDIDPFVACITTLPVPGQHCPTSY